jgi:hypothetical protein
MTTDDILLHIFYRVATTLPEIPRHPQAKLYPSELVTIGILFALKGGSFRIFYRWLKRDYSDSSKPIKIGVNCSWLIRSSSRSLTAIRLN